MRIEITWDEFISIYSPENDHVHLAAAILKNESRNEAGIGIVGIDPIILIENTDDPTRTSRKFPGSSFSDKNIPNTLRTTNEFLNELEEFGFGLRQYEGLLKYFKSYDEKLFDKNKPDYNDYLFMMRKFLISSVLSKTGYLVRLEEKPVYIDQGKNEDNEEHKSFRVFFGAIRCASAPFPKDSKKFYRINQSTVKLLLPKDYLEIVKFQKMYDSQRNELDRKKIVLKEHLHKCFYYGYRRPLVKFIENRS